jgi:hypothetical protein
MLGSEWEQDVTQSKDKEQKELGQRLTTLKNRMITKDQNTGAVKTINL